MSPTITICIPTLKRPEMLALTLQHLSQTRQASQLDVRVFVDHTTEERLADVDYVRDAYFPTANIYHATNHVLCGGGSWNILQSLKSGYETGADFIFLIEEDILIRPKFFDRHFEMQASGDFFVTCGRKLPNRDEFYYSNPGTCYRREKLALVIPHINDKYFANQTAYLEQHFPDMQDAGVLDDGVVRRVMQSVGGKALCAIPPIVSHVGFHYYGRMPQFTVEGTLPEKIEKLRVLLTKINPADRYSSDFEPYPK
jgi:hypothetical protein